MGWKSIREKQYALNEIRKKDKLAAFMFGCMRQIELASRHCEEEGLAEAVGDSFKDLEDTLKSYFPDMFKGEKDDLNEAIAKTYPWVLF